MWLTLPSNPWWFEGKYLSLHANNHNLASTKHFMNRIEIDELNYQDYQHLDIVAYSFARGGVSVNAWFQSSASPKQVLQQSNSSLASITFFFIHLGR